MVTAISGRVSRRSERLPNVSIIQTAGNAPMKFTRPKMQEARRAPNVLKPDSEKI